MKYDYTTPECLCINVYAEGVLCTSNTNVESKNDDFGFDQNYDIL